MSSRDSISGRTDISAGDDVSTDDSQSFCPGAKSVTARTQALVEHLAASHAVPGELGALQNLTPRAVSSDNSIPEVKSRSIFEPLFKDIA